MSPRPSTLKSALLGKGGFDFLFGEAGNDRMIWNPGDDTDLAEGGDGIDTAEVNGDNGAEMFTVTANGLRVRFDRIDPAPFSIDIGTTENLVLNMNGGDDTFSATGDLAGLNFSVTVDGGTGNDTILGSNGADLLLGGDDNDFTDGQQGSDRAFLGAGDDVFQWDPGDGSDTVEGGDGTDTLLFNGSAGDETFAVSANGGRALFTRNLGNIVMDLNDVESIGVNALGGADRITVNDLTGTDVIAVGISLASTIAGTTGDGQADAVIVTGTNSNDAVQVQGSPELVTVAGLPAFVGVSRAEAANDELEINTLGGDDTISAVTLAAGTIKQLTIDSGAGNDLVIGSQGVDVLRAGDGNDVVTGGQGNDTAFGAGDDLFVWGPGGGNDTIEGQDGFDQLLFIGSGDNENITISASGARVIFFRNVDNVTMDLDDVERIDFHALGGADNIVINDLSGTDVTLVAIDLESAFGSGVGDGQVDHVTVAGTGGADAFVIAGAGGNVNVVGGSSSVAILHTEAATDQIVINGLAGNDVIEATGLGTAMGFTANGGDGNDVLIGSAGADTLRGEAGDDVLIGGASVDVLDGGPGSNIVIQDFLMI
jgi:Ca2+-binding RTX toxin-like protein